MSNNHVKCCGVTVPALLAIYGIWTERSSPGYNVLQQDTCSFVY